MKKYIFYLITGVLFVLAGCVSPDELTPTEESIALSSVSATFAEGNYTYNMDPNAIFSTSVTEANIEDIKIRVPWFYPEPSNNTTSITRMQIRAIIGNGCSIEPDLGICDLTQKNYFTLTDFDGNKRQICISGEIYKLTGCDITDLKVTDNATGAVYSGVIDNTKKIISIISVDDITDAKITYSLSSHATATISSGNFEHADLSAEPQITVTAHDGVTTQTYTIKRDIPNKIERGIRVGSYKLLFAKKLADDLGITVLDMTGGLAVTKDYVVLNTRNQNSVYINAKSGDKVGEINLGAIKGSTTNFYNTADSDGNILINNLAPNGGTFKIWKLSSVTGTPELFIDWAASGSAAIGRKVSINGSINGNAIITAPFHDRESQYARWTVVGGVLTSQNPEIVSVTGVAITNNNIDVISSSNTNKTSDYYMIGYSSNRLSRINGTTNAVSAQLNALDANYVCSTVDYVNFNNVGYVAFNHANPWTWGQADQVWIINADGDFSGNPTSVAFWASEIDKYGSHILGNTNGNYTGDVAFRSSDDGYYLYFYFMFTNGYVVGVQFDCIDM